MKIIHLDGHASPNSVDGIKTVVWTIARHQAACGHRVGLVVNDPPDAAAYDYARRANIDLLFVPATRWSYDRAINSHLFGREPADIAHFHSVYIPRHATLARTLRRRGTPYVVTPHGGLMPQILARGRLKKQTYNVLIERKRIQGAAAIAYVTPSGEADIRRFVPHFEGPIRWTPNPVDTSLLGQIPWQPNFDQPRLTFLGRYDVFHKGLDRLAEIAKRLPSVEFEIFGLEDPKTRRHMETIRRFRPSNLKINAPIFDEQKLETLSQSTMYIQVSRWEALSISILEAMALGVPAVISESMSMAGMFSKNDLGLVVSTKPARAAEQIRDALANPSQLQDWSRRSRAYAEHHFSPQAVTRAILGVYDAALEFHACRQDRKGQLLDAKCDARSSSARFGEHQKEEIGDAGNFKRFLD